MAEPVLQAERVLRTLARHEVRYVLIGALAATFHGSPLRTEDIDICPDPGSRNLDSLGAALMELGAKEWDARKDEAVPRLFDAEMLRVDRLWILMTEAGRLGHLLQARRLSRLRGPCPPRYPVSHRRHLGRRGGSRGHHPVQGTSRS